MVRDSVGSEILFSGGSPSTRREDARAVLNQQLALSAFWTLPLYFIRGETATWVEKYILTPQLLALVPSAGTTAIWPARSQALSEVFAGGTVVWSAASKIPLTQSVTRWVSRFVARILAKYVGRFAAGSALSATGIGAVASAFIDAGLLAWAVSDLWNAKSDLIEGLLDEWFPR